MIKYEASRMLSFYINHKILHYVVAKFNNTNDRLRLDLTNLTQQTNSFCLKKLKNY